MITIGFFNYLEFFLGFLFTEDTQHPLQSRSDGHSNHDPPANYIGLRPLPRHSGWRMEYT